MQQVVHSFDEIELEKDSTIQKDTLERMKLYHDRIVKSYGFNLGRPSNAFFAFNGKGSKLDLISGKMENFPYFYEVAGPCHAGISQVTEEYTDGILDIQTSMFTPTAKDMLEFIFLEGKSPWSKALEHTAVLKDKDTGFITGIVLLNTAKTSIKLFTNLLIAGRLRSQWGLDKVWSKFVTSGMPPEFAIFLSTYFREHYKHDTSRSAISNEAPYIGDMPFNTGDGQFFDPLRLLNHDPKEDSERLGLKQTPNPCNYLWNGTTLSGYIGPYHFSSFRSEVLTEAINKDHPINQDRIKKINEALMNKQTNFRGVWEWH